jgi:hypothetical protein
MGQQETMWATGSALRRLILTLLVTALLAAMMAVSAGSAFAAGKADPPCKGSQAFDCSSAHLSVKRTISRSRTLAARLGPP